MSDTMGTLRTVGDFMDRYIAKKLPAFHSFRWDQKTPIKGYSIKITGADTDDLGTAANPRGVRSTLEVMLAVKTEDHATTETKHTDDFDLQDLAASLLEDAHNELRAMQIEERQRTFFSLYADGFGSVEDYEFNDTSEVQRVIASFELVAFFQ